MNRCIYLHQRIAIFMGQRGAMIDMIRNRWAPHLARKHGVRLFGVWATAGSTGEWPEVRAQWEFDDWDHFALASDGQHPMEERDTYLTELWNQALDFRRGGRSLLLRPAAYTPDLATIRGDAITREVVFCEDVRSRPGRMTAYHDALASSFVPLAEARGLRLLGAYEHAVVPNTGLNLWGMAGNAPRRLRAITGCVPSGSRPTARAGTGASSARSTMPRRTSGSFADSRSTAGPMNQQGPFVEHVDESWDWYYEVILMMTVRACRAVIPRLAANGGGTIVTTAAYSVRAPKPLIPPYTSMKAAVLTLSKILAKTYGDDGIRVNTVCPGLFDTEVNDFIRATRAEQYGVPLEDAIYTHLSSNPAWNMRVALDRGGRPQEAGELIAFLLSDRAAYMTGAVINIDGGTDF